MMNRKQFTSFLLNHNIMPTNKPISHGLAYDITTKLCRDCSAYINCNNSDCFWYIAYKQIKKK